MLTDRRVDGQTDREEASGVRRQASEGFSRLPKIGSQPSVCPPVSLSVSGDRLWVPDNPDGSGWAEVDWVSAVRASRYFYRHAEPHDEAVELLPPFYRVVTRLDTPALHAPHENSYYVPRERLADFLAELALAGGAETIWHVEPCVEPPDEARVRQPGTR